MKQRVVSRKKEDIHLTILVDGCPEDFKKLYLDLKHIIHKHNAGSKKKVSYDLNFLPTPEIWKEKPQESLRRFQIGKVDLVKYVFPQQK